MDLRGAKSNVMSLIRTYWNRNCPLVALVWAHGHLSRLEFTKITGELNKSKGRGHSLRSSHVLGTDFPTGGMLRLPKISSMPTLSAGETDRGNRAAAMQPRSGSQSGQCKETSGLGSRPDRIWFIQTNGSDRQGAASELRSALVYFSYAS
jgi:hypothetical protein